MKYLQERKRPEGVQMHSFSEVNQNFGLKYLDFSILGGPFRQPQNATSRRMRRLVAKNTGWESLTASPETRWREG
jgi:hypothetical protein